MIKVKSDNDIELMRAAGRIAAKALMAGGRAVREGISTAELDKIVQNEIESAGAVASCIGYGGFPCCSCISVNDVVIHGIPSKSQILKNGDIVSIDVVAGYKGFHGDCAATFTVGEVSPEAQRLIDVTKQSFFEGIKFAREGCRVSDISHAVQTYAEKNGFSVVRDFVGHGIGREMHEAPEVPNFGAQGHGPRLMPGMTIAVEPMITQFKYDVSVLKDGWTVVTKDGGLAAHYEHTILITKDMPEILTSVDGEIV